MNVSEIRANARISFKMNTLSGDVFYTYEYGETRNLNETDNVQTEKTKLWEEVVAELDKQILSTQEAYKK